MPTQGKAGDPYVQQRVATMAINLETGHLWLRHVAGLWEAGRRTRRSSAGNRARHLMEAWATDTVQHAIRACGARGADPAQPAGAHPTATSPSTSATTTPTRSWRRSAARCSASPTTPRSIGRDEALPSACRRPSTVDEHRRVRLLDLVPAGPIELF